MGHPEEPKDLQKYEVVIPSAWLVTKENQSNTSLPAGKGRDDDLENE